MRPLADRPLTLFHSLVARGLVFVVVAALFLEGILAMGIELQRRPRGDREQRTSAMVKLRLPNAADEPLALVDLAWQRSLALEAARIWHGRLPSRAFNGRGNVD